MTDFLSETIRDEMDQARKAARRKQAKLVVRVHGEDFPILRQWKNGFSTDTGPRLGLRGFVDLYDGDRHLRQVLVVASFEKEGECLFEVKTSTQASESAPAVDFVRDRPEPKGLLPHS